MKLEFIEDGFDGAPLILLYAGTPREVALLRDVLRRLGSVVGARFAIHELTFVQAVDNCSLNVVSGHSDNGVVGSPLKFEWILGKESWLQVEELLQPFCEERSTEAFQHLNPAESPQVIYSTDRAW